MAELRRRTGTGVLAEAADEDRILDEEEQDWIVEELLGLNLQSSAIWRLASSLLVLACFIVYILIPFRSSAPSSPFLVTLSSRYLILLELLAHGLTGLLDIRLPVNLSSGESASNSEKYLPRIQKFCIMAAKHFQGMFPRASKERLASISHFCTMTALSSAVLRVLLNVYFGWHRRITQEDALLTTAPTLVLLISELAKHSAKELDKDIQELRSLKYENKGA